MNTNPQSYKARQALSWLAYTIATVCIVMIFVGLVFLHEDTGPSAVLPAFLVGGFCHYEALKYRSLNLASRTVFDKEAEEALARQMLSVALTPLAFIYIFGGCLIIGKVLIDLGIL